MNDQTLQVLTTLATKLGTTAEYLWGVLLRQATIAGVMNLTIVAIMVVAAVLLARFVRGKTKKIDDGTGWERAAWEGEGAFFAWGAVFFFGAITFVAVIIEVPAAITAFVNPEYWALSRILK